MKQASYPCDLKNCSSIGSVFNLCATVLATYKTKQNKKSHNDRNGTLDFFFFLPLGFKLIQRFILTLCYRQASTTATPHRRRPPENSSCGWKAWPQSRGRCGWSCRKKWRPRGGRDPGNSPWPWAARCCRSPGRPCIEGKVGRRISRGAMSTQLTVERTKAYLLLEDNDVPVHELIQGLVQRDIVVLYPLR